MSLSAPSRKRLESFAPAICGMSEHDIEAAIMRDGASPFRDEILSLGREGGYSAYYAPVDWLNDNADIVIAGVTPGRQQAADALKMLRRALQAGKSADEASRIAKESAAFKGGMRKLAHLIHEHSCDSLAGIA